jgi:methylmalonyl-CoA/ethylmalonyl-CoA epimerase
VLKILRIDHIAQAVPELGPQIELLESLFGFRANEPNLQGARDMLSVKLAVPGSSDIDWELVAPATPDSFLNRFLNGSAGPGLHHVQCWVPDVGEAQRELRSMGFEPWSDREPEEPDGEWYEVFLHPRQSGMGFLFQFRGEATERQHPRPPPPRFEEHTLGIVAINHLSHAFHDRVALAQWYEQVFGMERFYSSPAGDDRAFTTEVLETPTRQMRWEVLEPQGEGSFVQRFLDRRGPGMHHVTFEVGDWERALDACAYHGIPVFGAREGETGGSVWREAFIHPRHTGGMLVQLFWQERPEVWI